MRRSIQIDVLGHKVFNDFYDPLPDSDYRKKRIREMIENLWNDINNGRFIKRNRPYPKKYRDLGVTNLYVDEVKSDRVIYTMRTEPNRKIWQFLDYLDHEEYDLLFENKGSS